MKSMDCCPKAETFRAVIRALEVRICWLEVAHGTLKFTNKLIGVEETGNKLQPAKSTMISNG